MKKLDFVLDHTTVFETFKEWHDRTTDFLILYKYQGNTRLNTN